MYRVLCAILAIALLFPLLTACGSKANLPPTAPAETTVPTVTTSPIETSAPPETTLPPETAPAAEVSTEPATTESATLPYIQLIDRADQSIFNGPGYDYGFVGTVQKPGTYTIVEEEWDWEGNLWGRLKSGIGWVDLTQIRSQDYAQALISANYADEYLLSHGAYHEYLCEETDYAVTVAFRAYAVLRNVELFAYNINTGIPVPEEPFFTLPEWTPDMPLVALLAFPGDMSSYGIRFVDENGDAHIYSIYISLRNGALMLTAG